MASEIFSLVGRIALDGAASVTSGLTRVQETAQSAQGKLKKFGEGVQAAGEKATKAGQGFTQYVTAPLALVGGVAVSASSDIEQANGRIMASLGLSRKEAEAYTKSARNLWKNGFGENVQQAAEYISIVGRNIRDLPTAELENVTRQAAEMEKVFGVDIAESTRTASVLMNNFGMESSSAMDLITAGFQQGGDYSGELLDTLREYGPQFASMGFNAEEMLNILIKGADAGAWNLDKVGDSVKEFNLRAQDGSKTTAEGFAAIGLNAAEMGQAIASGGESAQNAFMATVAGLAAMEDPVAQNIAGVNLFGTQWEDVRKEVILAMGDTRNVLGEVEGAADRAGKAINDNIAHRVKTTFRSVQDSLVPVGTIILDMADRVLPKVETAISTVSNLFGNLSPSAQMMIVIFGMIAAAIGPALIALGFMATGIGSLITLVAGFSAPVVAVVAVIGLLVGALVAAYAKSEDFRAIINKVFGTIAGIVQKGLMAAWGFIQSIWGQIQTFWAQNGEMILQAMRNVFNFLAPIVRVAMNLIVGTIAMYWNIAKTIFQGALNIIMGIVQFFAALFTGNWAALWESVKQILTGGLQVIWGIIQLVLMSTIMGIIRRFGGAITGFFGPLVTRVTGFFKSMGSGITGAVNGFRASATALINNMVTSIARFFNKMSTDAALIFLKMVNAGKTQFNNLKNAIVNPIQSAQKLVKTAIDKIKGFFTNLQLKIPKISMPPLPHFEVKGKFSLSPPSVPKIGVNWYAEGGVFNGASIIGVGEQPGVKEAVVPLSGNHMLPFARAIAALMPAGGGGDTFHIEIKASDIREFNDLIRILQDFRQSVRRGGAIYGTN